MGAVFGLFAGFYYWIEKIVGLRYDQTLGNLHFAVFFVGVNLTFFPMHFLLRRRAFWFKSINALYLLIDLETSIFKDSTDIKCLVGQRAWEVGLKKCTSVLSDQPQVAWLTQVNLYFKIPTRISKWVRSFIRTHEISVLKCRERLRQSSLEYRRNLNNDITARFSLSESKRENGNLEWGFRLHNLNVTEWYWNKEYNTQTIKVNNWVKFVSTGGKIAKQAKAFSNFWDNVVKYFYIDKSGNMILAKPIGLRYHRYKNFPFNKVNPHLEKHNNRLNLVLFNIRLTKRSFSNISALDNNLSSDRVSKEKQNALSLKWPKSWKKIEERVFIKQQTLSRLAKIKGPKSISVQNYQNQLIVSLDFRLIAVRRIKNNKGTKTAGVDKFIPKSEKDWIFLVEELIKLDQYKCQPVRRVNIPKGKSKTRPLGIPTIWDRTVQSLFKLVTEPITEVYADLNSYGFRKNRSAVQALARVRTILLSKNNVENIVILDLDIKGFFDNINHKWIMENFPISTKYQHVLKSWLISGVLINQNLEETIAGVPQGGIISPVISNFTLNGLEDCIKGSIAKITSSKNLVKEYYGQRSGTNVVKRFNIQFVRYADDFLVTCRSIYIAKEFIKPAIVKFLNVRGLLLSKEKSSIFRLKDKDLEFLGYKFMFRKKWKANGLFRGKSGRPGVAVVPQKAKFQSICKRIRNIFHFNLNWNAYTLIAKVNPIINGWCNYFRYGQSVCYRKKLEYYLYKLAWKWAKRKHRRWGRKRIAKTYFLDINRTKFKGRLWAFRGQTFNNSRYKDDDSGKKIYLVNPIADIDTLAMFSERILNKDMGIHGYHKDVKELEEYIANQRDKNRKKYKTLKENLFTRQKGVCSVCFKTIKEDEDTDIHHILPISLGGAKSKIENMALVHKMCHIEHHSINEK